MVEKKHKISEYSEKRPSQHSLRGGYDFEDYLTLFLMVNIFTEGTCSDILKLQYTELSPFDDIYWRSEDVTFAIQAKWNKPGTLRSLFSKITSSRSVLAKYIKSNQLSEKRLFAFCVEEIPESVKLNELFGYDIYQIDDDMIMKYDLPEELNGCYIYCFKNKHELNRWLESWFLTKYGTDGSYIYLKALDEIKDISLSQDKFIDQKRALNILRLHKNDTPEYVHDPLSLIERPNLISEVNALIEEDINVLVLGEPGCGKSALLDKLTYLMKDNLKNRALRRYSFFISPDEKLNIERLDPNFFINAMYYSNKWYRSDCASRITSSMLLEDLRGYEIDVILIIDGIDHVQRGKTIDVLNEFGRLINLLSANTRVKIVLSAQNLYQLPSNLHLNNFKEIIVPPLLINETREIVKSISNQVDSYIIDELHSKCVGNPLILKWLIQYLGEDIGNNKIASEKLHNIEPPKNAFDYVESLLNGLDDICKFTLQILCDFKYGFQREFYNEIAKALEIREIERLTLWKRIKHLFKNIGFDRYLVWHYLIEQVLDSKELEKCSPLIEILQKLPESNDRQMYESLAKIENRDKNLYDVCVSLKESVLEGRIRASSADNIVLFACDKLSKDNNLREMIKCAFTRFPIRKILDNGDFEDYVYESIAFTESEKISSSLLFPGAGSSILHEMVEIKDLLSYVADNAELSWLINNSPAETPLLFAGKLAFSIYNEDLDYKTAIKKFSLKTFDTREHYLGRYLTPLQNDKLMFNLDAAYQLGRILALNIKRDKLEIMLREPIHRDSIQWDIHRKVMFGAAQIILQKGSNTITNMYLEITEPDSTSMHSLYLYAYCEKKVNLDKFRLHMSTYYSVPKIIDALRKFSITSGYKEEERKLLSYVIAAYYIKDSLFVNSVKTAFLSTYYDSEIAISDIVTLLLPHYDSIDEGLSSLVKRVKSYKSHISNSQFHGYIEHLDYDLSLCDRMGIFQSCEERLFQSIDELCQLSVRVDRLSFIKTRLTTKGINYELAKSEKIAKKRKSHNPYTWKADSSKLACYYAITGNIKAAKNLVHESYRYRNLIQWRKDQSVYLLINSYREAAKYLDNQTVLKLLSKTSSYFPILDEITDSDDSEYWFDELLKFVYEPCKPAESLVLKHIYRKIGIDNDWAARAGANFEAQLMNLDDKLHETWVLEIQRCVKRENAALINVPRAYYQFMVWVISSVLKNIVWRKSKCGIKFISEMKSWCLEFIQSEDAQACIEFSKFASLGRAYPPYFEDTIVGSQILLGEEPSFPVMDCFKDMSSMKADEIEITLIPEERLDKRNLISTMLEYRFIMPNWWGCKPQHTDQIIKALKGCNADAKEILCEYFSSYLGQNEKDYIPWFAEKLAHTLGELGLHDELTILVEEMTDYFINLFMDLEPDLEFSKSLANIIFYNSLP